MHLEVNCYPFFKDHSILTIRSWNRLIGFSSWGRNISINTSSSPHSADRWVESSRWFESRVFLRNDSRCFFPFLFLFVFCPFSLRSVSGAILRFYYRLFVLQTQLVLFIAAALYENSLETGTRQNPVSMPQHGTFLCILAVLSLSTGLIKCFPSFFWIPHL